MKHKRSMLGLWALVLVVLGVMVSQVLAAPPLIRHEGALTDASGNPAPDQTLSMRFRICTAETKGTVLWTEEQEVDVMNGAYSVLLGLVTPFPATLFANTSPRWLEVKAGTSPPLPRQQMASVPYALNAETLDALDSTKFSRSTHSHELSSLTGSALDAQIPTTITRDAELTTGLATKANQSHLHSGGDITTGSVAEARIDPLIARDAELTAGLATKANMSHPHSGTDITTGTVAEARIDPLIARDAELTAGLVTKANTSHPHSGTDITTGTVAEARIDPAIARDSEVINIVKENDGAGSGVDADLLDGQHASNFASTSHTQPFSSITGTATDEQIPDYITIEYAKSAGYAPSATHADYAESAGNAVNADTLDGKHASRFATANHNHNAAYVNATGDLMSGRLDGGVLIVVNEGSSSDNESVAVFGTASYVGEISNYGGDFQASGLYGRGVRGWAGNSGDGANYGGEFTADGTYGYGVYGVANGLYGTGVFGWANNTGNVENIGGYFGANGTAGKGVYAFGSSYGVHAEGGAIGVRGNTAMASGAGVMGEANNGAGAVGVWGVSSDGAAGYFDGNVAVVGTLTKSGGGFRIDHPLAPANKTLSHSFVDSPDMKNVYDGVVVLDDKGEAWVELPEWFEALNRDFRYQLTAIGGPGPNLHIAEKIAGNQFKIGGGSLGLEVSWQVTGIRQDAWANAHRIPVEEDKPESEQGYYLHPDLFGHPEELGVQWAHRPEQMRQMKEEQAKMRESGNAPS